MTNQNAKCVFIAVIISLFSTVIFANEKQAIQKTFTFEKYVVGQIPKGWVISETLSNSIFGLKNTDGILADWEIVQNSNSSTERNVLAVRKINHSENSVFNIIHTNNPQFKDGTLSVKVRAKSGEIDQGGGPIWRVKDRNNYYVARYNPLENNFRIYYVKDGVRVQLQSSDNYNDGKSKWFTIKISHIDETL